MFIKITILETDSTYLMEFPFWHTNSANFTYRTLNYSKYSDRDRLFLSLYVTSTSIENTE